MSVTLLVQRLWNAAEHGDISGYLGPITSLGGDHGTFPFRNYKRSWVKWCRQFV